MASMPDFCDALAAAAVQGDRSAYGALVEATYDEVAGFVALRLPRREAIDEVVQSTYVDAWLAIRSYDPTQPLTAWLKGVARNRILRWQRDRQRAARLVAMPEPIAAPAMDVEAEVPAELLARLRRCLERLPETARRLLAARHVDGEDLPAVAARAGLSLGATATRLCRWRSALRLCLERTEP